MSALRLVLGDQLSDGLAGLVDLDPAADTVLLAEVSGEATYVRHHKQKIALVFSAMRHFAEALRARGVTVRYVRIDDPDTTGSIAGEVARAVAELAPARVVLTEPGEWRLLDVFRDLVETLPVPVEIREDDRFLCSHAAFNRWAEGRAGYRMEFFYREMRRRTGYLMEGDRPVGGQWNFDPENRKKLPRGQRLPERLRFPPDAVTAAAMSDVARLFPDHFGDLDTFGWPVTREQALAALAHFVAEALPGFGDYQDAMKRGEDFLHHSLLSAPLNLGLLDPREVCEAALAAFRRGEAPLNAVEGFLRQILGWREFVRGLYWREGPEYGRSNALGADRALPEFYWTGETDCVCLAEAIGATRRNAYAHHIQRLMVTGNFALLAGIDPVAVQEWYLLVYADAFEWVELPNTHGMALFADGGVLASKPYAASGAYLDRMSDYCATCRFNPRQRTGEGACPITRLYWDFLIRNEDRLARNPRMAMPYRHVAAMPEGERAAIRAEATAWLDRVAPIQKRQ